uniref:ACB domain-containing protein n=1 Tax=Anser cygnoides TaxID=8845 RepID=A0A8B9EA63_ANSCY
MAEPGCGAQFRAAVRVIQGLPRSGSYRPSYEEMLRFYSYYKQATAGRCQGPRPGFWDPIGRYKWDAWHSLGRMSKEEAMAAYVAEMKKVAQKVIDTVPMDEATREMFKYFEPLYEVIRDMPRPPEDFFKGEGDGQEQAADPSQDERASSPAQERREEALPGEQQDGQRAPGGGLAPAAGMHEGSQVASDSEGEVFCDTLEQMEPEQVTSPRGRTASRRAGVPPCHGRNVPCRQPCSERAALCLCVLLSPLHCFPGSPATPPTPAGVPAKQPCCVPVPLEPGPRHRGQAEGPSGCPSSTRSLPRCCSVAPAGRRRPSRAGPELCRRPLAPPLARCSLLVPALAGSAVPPAASGASSAAASARGQEARGRPRPPGPPPRPPAAPGEGGGVSGPFFSTPAQAGQPLAKRGLSPNSAQAGPEPRAPRAAGRGERGEGRRRAGRSGTGLAAPGADRGGCSAGLLAPSRCSLPAGEPWGARAGAEQRGEGCDHQRLGAVATSPVRPLSSPLGAQAAPCFTPPGQVPFVVPRLCQLCLLPCTAGPVAPLRQPGLERGSPAA